MDAVTSTEWVVAIARAVDLNHAFVFEKGPTTNSFHRKSSCCSEAHRK